MIHFNRISHYKPSILGIPMAMESPNYLWMDIGQKPRGCCRLLDGLGEFFHLKVESDDGNRWWRHTHTCVYIYIHIYIYLIWCMHACIVYIYIHKYMIYHSYCMWLKWIKWMTDCLQLTILPNKQYRLIREGRCNILAASIAASMATRVAVDYTSFARGWLTSFLFPW